MTDGTQKSYKINEKKTWTNDKEQEEKDNAGRYVKDTVYENTLTQ